MKQPTPAQRLAELRKRLGMAQSREGILHEQTQHMLLTPKRGKGINANTYRFRRIILEDKDTAEIYKNNLPGFRVQMDTFREMASKIYDESYKYRTVRTMQRHTSDPWAVWHYLTSQLSTAHNVLPLLPFLMLYAAFEKELNDFVRAHYGFDSLGAYLSPALNVFMDLKNPRRSSMKKTYKQLYALAEKVTELSGVPVPEELKPDDDTEDDDDTGVPQDEYESVEVNLVKEGMRVVSEWAMVEAGLYERIFGAPLPYVAPYSKKAMEALADSITDTD